MSIPIINLSDMKLGEKANVIGLNASSAAARQRFFACGLVPGVEISIVRMAPLGDPLQVRLDGDIMLSIRKSEGRDVTVQLTQ